MTQKKDTPKDPYNRHVKLWPVLYTIAHGFICRKFHMTHDEVAVEGPVLLIPNHVTNWDPLLVGMSLRRKHMYFVATEHIFRLGFLSKLLKFFFGPIARPKGGSSLETIRECVQHFKKGHSICLFAEGEATWNGQTHPIFPATGKLVRLSGATLVTYRLEGGYLSFPRWSTKLHKGAVNGHVVGIYPPEQLKKMKAEEINALIDADLYENAFDRQKESPLTFRSKAPAECLDRLLYLCPKCHRTGTLKTKGDLLSCSCGLKTHFTEQGFFAPQVLTDDGKTFETLLQWDQWQKEELRDLYSDVSDSETDEPLFSDDDLTLTLVTSGHREEPLGSGALTLFHDVLKFADHVFPLQEIVSMAIVQANRLLFTINDAYYEAISPKKAVVNLRKYLDVWEFAKRSQI